jgi:hypothetical protein
MYYADDITRLGSIYLEYISRIRNTALIVIGNNEINEAMFQNINHQIIRMLTVPDMKGQGQPTCLVTRKKNKKKRCNSFMYVYNVSCAHNAKHV